MNETLHFNKLLGLNAIDDDNNLGGEKSLACSHELEDEAMRYHKTMHRRRILESLEARLLLTAEATPLLTASLTAEAVMWPDEESTIADFNGDGREDRIAFSSTIVEIRFADDAGVFGEPDRVIDLSEIVELDFPPPGQHQHLDADVELIASADLNNDSLTDFVVTIDDVESTRFVAMISNGEGEFQKHQEWTPPRVWAGNIRQTKLMDVDGNGQLDFVASSAQPEVDEWIGPTLYIWRADDMGEFSEEPETYSTIGTPQDFVLRDINEDGIDDLYVRHGGTSRQPIYLNGPGGVSVLFGTGGKLADPVRISTGRVPGRWVSDLIAPYAYDYSEGAYALVDTAATDFRVVNSSLHKDIWFGDFNGDSRTDVYVEASVFRQLPSEAYISTEDGQFNVIAMESATLTQRIEHVGDFNNDGLDDILVGGSEGVSTLLSSGDTFSDPIPSAGIPADFSSSAVGDFNSDGTKDLVGLFIDEQQNEYVAMALGNGDGTWAMGDAQVNLGEMLPDNESRRERRELHLLDVNADGHLDALSPVANWYRITESDSSWIRFRPEYKAFDVLYGNGEEFSEPISLSFDVNNWTYGDVNRDGFQDILGLKSAFDGTLDRQFKLQVAYGNAEGISEVYEMPLDIFVDERSSGDVVNETIQVVDIDSDGDNEVVIFSGNGFEVYQYEDDTTYRVIMESDVGFPANKLFVQDVTGDQIPDITVNPEIDIVSWEPAPPASMTFAILEGSADGTFAEPVFNFAFFLDASLALIEENDGRVDFFVEHRLGFGKFQSAELLPVPGDFDSNGQLDAHDIDLLCSATRNDEATEDENAMFDQNGDMLLTLADVETWVANVANTHVGDTDIDGDVDFADFLRLSSKFGATDALWSDGDFNCDGEVTFADFLLLSANFGTTS